VARARAVVGARPVAEAEVVAGDFSTELDYVRGSEADAVGSKTATEIKYFAPGVVEGILILDSPGGEEVERLVPGDVVAAELGKQEGFARLLDGRGWLDLSHTGVEEVHPWAARVMKKPGVLEVDDVQSLAYLSWDEDKLTPLAQHLALPTRVVKELERRGVSSASPIQEAVFDRVHRGESVCLQSQTGTGKTLAMVLPLLAAMAEESEWGEDGDKIIIVTSTRELAVQIFSEIDSMGFFAQGKGYATTLIVGNIPPEESIMKANVIIGTPNELGGYLHKSTPIISHMNTRLRAIVLDEVDSYTKSPKVFASKWGMQRKRRLFRKRKMVLDQRLGEFNTGVIEWFMKRQLAYSRRQDLQVLAASATMNRNKAEKVFRMLRWDPLGRWYRNPPPLVRPAAMAKVDWQAIPMMPTIPIHLQHRYVKVLPGKTDFVIKEDHWTRTNEEIIKLYMKTTHSRWRPRDFLPEWGAKAVKAELAAALLNALHDTLKSRPVNAGSAMVIICRTVGLEVKEAVKRLNGWGLHEVEALHQALWEDSDDTFSNNWEKYSYDQKDHSHEIAQRHRALNVRLGTASHKNFNMGGFEWQKMQERKGNGECTSPVILSYEGAGRGLHFDGVDTVYILGIPTKPEYYLHMAGRAGRLGHKGGKVVSIVPNRATKVLHAWRNKIGPGIFFDEEEVVRDRSRPVPGEKVYRPGERRKVRPPEEGRNMHGPWADQERMRLRDQKRARGGQMLLPPGQEFAPMPGEEEEEEDEDFVETERKEQLYEEMDRVLEEVPAQDRFRGSGRGGSGAPPR